MVAVNLQVRVLAKQTFDELICRTNCFKSMERDCVLYTWVMCVKSDDVVYTHANQFLERECTVEGFSGTSLVLSALVQEWHNYVDTAGFSTDGSNHSLQVLEMIIR